uniref:Uncharacterized protein n=1 Tax=Plectus sambesii TaxID=2011161 RepID=A0A914WIX3_9BILA
MDLTEQYQEQPSPGLNAIPLQYYSDTGQDPLSAFAQSNQHCNNLFNQLTSARHEHPACVDELADLNRRQQEAVNGMRQAQTAIQLQQSVTQLQNYLRALESKIATIRAQLLNQIETSGRLMSHAMQVLVNQKLVDWLVRQKACSCGTKSENQRLYDELGHLDIMFEEFGREILFLVNLIASFYQTLNATDDFEAIQSLQALRTDIVDHSKLFVWQSVIVAVQPPAVLVKCRGSDSHRSTRFPCHTEIRLLGGDALGVRGRCSLTRVELIGEDMARRIQADPAQIAVKDTSLHLTYNESRFEVDAKTSGGQLGACRAPFDRIRLVENTAQKRPASVMSSASGGEERKGTRRQLLKEKDASIQG